MTDVLERTLPPDDSRHGTATGYHNHGCRCVSCRVAGSAYARLRRARRAKATECPNCGGPGGLYSGNECEACYMYRWRNGRRRTEDVWSPPDRFCATCDRLMESGQALRNGRCEACSRYLSRNGCERPRRLWEVGVVKVIRPTADWSQAACIGEPLDLFFAECPELVEQARAICHTCPIVEGCADWALAVPEEWGVWGALTPKERNAIRRKRRAKGRAA